jgi:hypothetical protein
MSMVQEIDAIACSGLQEEVNLRVGQQKERGVMRIRRTEGLCIGLKKGLLRERV